SVPRGEPAGVGSALGLVRAPELLVLDEPTAAMDVETRRRFWASMRQLAAARRTVLSPPHSLDEPDEYADRIVLMAEGRVVADGPATAMKAVVGGRTIRATLPGVPDVVLCALPGVGAVERHGDAVRLTCTDSDLALRALLAGHPDARDLEVGG